MSKITLENKNGKTTIINKISYPETVNERICNTILSGVFEGFLPVTICHKREETKIQCVVQGLIPVAQYFYGTVTKAMFLDFVYKIALLIKSCEKNKINANNLDLHKDRIFIDPQNQRVKCIFWPVVNNQIETPPHFFLKQIPFELHFNPCENDDYLEIYKSFFSDVIPFSINNFEKLVLNLMGKKSNDCCNTPSKVSNGVAWEKTKINERDIYQKNKVAIEYDPFGSSSEIKKVEKSEMISELDKKKIFCCYCGKVNQFDSNYCIQCGKSLKTDSTKDRRVSPVLIRLKTNKSYLVNKNIYVIGKEHSCDLFICDNNYISRIHAVILKRDNRYYIVDQNSTNKTFVDGKFVPANNEVELLSGTKICFANEEFLFKIGL